MARVGPVRPRKRVRSEDASGSASEGSSDFTLERRYPLRDRPSVEAEADGQQTSERDVSSDLAQMSSVPPESGDGMLFLQILTGEVLIVFCRA